MKFRGARKLYALGLVCLSLTAISITLIITQPPGVDIMEFFTWAGGALAVIKALFIGGNAYEHKITNPAHLTGPATES